MRQDYHRRRGSFTIIRCLHRRQKCEKDASFRRQFSTTHWPVTTVPPHLYRWIHIFEWLRVASLLFTSLMLGVRALAPMVVVAMKCVWCLVFGVGRVWCLYVCSVVEFWVVFFACIIMLPTKFHCSGISWHKKRDTPGYLGDIMGCLPRELVVPIPLPVAFWV